MARCSRCAFSAQKLAPLSQVCAAKRGARRASSAEEIERDVVRKARYVLASSQARFSRTRDVFFLLDYSIEYLSALVKFVEIHLF